MNDPLGLFSTGSGGSDPLGLFSSNVSPEYQKYSDAYDADNQIPIPGSPAKAPKMSPEEFQKLQFSRNPTLANIARAGVEQGLNLAGGTLGMFAAPIQSAATGIANLSQGKAPEFGKTYEESLNNFSSIGSQAAQALGQSNEFTQNVGGVVGDVMNNLIPMAPLHIPTAGGKLPGVSSVVAKDMQGISVPKKGTVESKVDALINEPVPTKDPLGLFEKTPVEPGAGAFDKIVESQIAGAQEPIRPYTTPIDFIKNQLEAQKQSDVQAVLDARNAEMQQQVARQTSLDMNAAERQRQAAASTGFDEYLQQNKQAFDQAASPLADQLNALQEQMNASKQQQLLEQQTALEQQRQQQAQAALQARQQALEQGVAQRTALDFNAAERQRQAQAEVPGLQEYQTKLQQEIEALQQQKQLEQQKQALARSEQEAQASAFKQRQAQLAIEQRQKALEDSVRQGAQEAQLQASRNNALREQAALRQSMERAPVPGLEEARLKEIEDSIRKTQDLNTRGQQMSIVEDYGNNDPMSRMPNMRVDENGIPIRADLSMEAQNLQDPLQMHLWGDELPNQTGDGGIPLTQALDSMPKGPERDAAIRQLSNDVSSDFSLPENPSSGAGSPSLNSGMSRGQRGAIDFGAVVDSLSKGVDKVADAFDNFTMRLPKVSGPDQTLSKLYETTVISRPKPSAEILEAAKQAGDGPALWKDWQSGIQMASDKINNPMVKNAAQWFDFAKRKGDMGMRTLVRPIERTMSKLSKDEMVGLQKLIQAEMFGRKRFDDARVQEALSPKSYEAYKQLRDTYDEMYKLQNEQRLANGLPELSREDAYMASVFHGDWHVAVRDKEGKLLWYAQNPTRAVANKAVKFLQKYYEGNESVNPATIRTEYKAPGSNIPTEMMGSWRNIIDALGDSPDAGPLEQAYKAWVQGEGRNFLRQNLHQVEQKMNVRGAAGDQPWLDAKENAYNWAHAQIEYMQKTMRYLPMQEALDNVKTFLSDPELQQSQPNNIGLLRAYTANALGLNGRLTAALEAYAGKALGRSSNAPRSAVGALKSATYAAMLWGSPGYWLATPIQALPASFAWFLSEKGKGTIGSLEPKQFAKIMIDAMQANIGRDEHVTNPFNREALKWADDNQVVTSGMFDPESNLGKNKTLSRISKVGNATVSLPDTFSRRQLFLTFANAYKEGGMPKEEAFMRSAEQVEKIMVSMRREDRPIAIQKLGALGDAAWVFKAPVANMYNHLSIFARDAAKGNYKPLVAYLGAMSLIGGVMALPFINELDALLDSVKDLAAEKSPTIYNELKDIPTPKEALLSHFPDKDVLGQILNYGAVSAATGINMSTRFKNDIGDISNPMKTLQGPLMQEFKEWGKASDLVTNPGMNSVAQAAYQFAPGPVARGILENTMPQFKTNVQPNDGSVNFKNPNNVHNPDMYINRDSFDRAARMAGLTSLKEAQYKDKNYLNTQISMRQKSLRDAAFERAWESINDNNTTGATRNIRIFLQNGGDLGDAFAARALREGVDPQTYMQIHANTLSKILDVQRRMEMK